MISERVQAAKVLILSSFGDAQYPGDDRLVNAPTHCPECAEVANAFRGQDWRNLSREFVIQNKDALLLLTGDAFHYFLPGYMLHCAETPLDFDTAAPSIIYCLSPPATPRVQRWQLFSKRYEKFTSEQSFATMKYLELAQERERADRKEETTSVDAALHWWRERVTGAVASPAPPSSDEERHPTPFDGRIRAVQAAILTSFRDVKYPGDDALVAAVPAARAVQASEIAETFRGLDWRELSQELLWDYSDVLSMLSASAFHYFLPGYMLTSAEGGYAEYGSVHADVAYVLTPPAPDDPDDERMFAERVRASTDEQAHAVVQYLELVRDRKRADFERVGNAPSEDTFEPALRWWRERAGRP